MRLFDSPRAPNPRRVRWFLAEKQAEIEIVSVDVFKGEHKTPDYVARVGLANVPALELDDGTTITESIAICRYLESVFPEPNMFGRDAREVAVIEMWTRRTELLLANPLMMAVRHTHPALAALDTQVPAIAEANVGAATRALRFFDRRLGESAFIAAERVTMADIVAFTAIDFARMIKFALPDECANLVRWAGEMRSRPAAAAGT
ncbi:glutathione S-transferase [Sphingomonas sp. NBWT7]|uniref:glutathione S-transferase family protein n=1 Tax=Sphingomonas sp. NBWT7 TaxID=2596913 RepID=UPI00162AA136|nr:glutathione S-transferase [Sphingomonas sp. NBWT7]QNE32932.1 glutathione S-transferase [Sphingomonas sp. NBWT7]